MSLRTGLSVPARSVKIVAAAALAIGCTTLFGIRHAAAQDEDSRMRVVVDGSRVHFEDVGPQQIDGRILVPVKGVLQKLGATVDWDPESHRVTCNNGNIDIVLHLGERMARVNGRELTMDVPAQTIGGRTMVPLRFLSEALGAKVRWAADMNTVFVTTDGGPQRTIDRRDGDRRTERDGDRPNNRQ